MQQAKRRILGLLWLVLAVAGGRASLATAEEPDQIYFEATVSQGASVLIKPQALVKLGATADLKMRSERAGGADFRLRYVVNAADQAPVTADVIGMVNGREVASGTIQFADAAAGTMTVEGGGYVWQVRAERMSAERMRRRLAQR